MMRMKMRMISALTALCVFALSASAEVAAPEDVRFYSVNLRNTLRWSPGSGAAHNTTYTVEYAIYGDAVEGSEQVAWRAVKQCVEITHTECDLSEQTHDIKDDYYGRVRANGPDSHSHWTETESRFKPLSDTIIGPPQVKVTLVENYVHVKLKGPFRWKSSRMKKGHSLLKTFSHMVYNVSMYNNRSKQMLYFLLQNDSLKLGPLEYESTHCVMAESHSLSLLLTSIPSDWSCITIPSDPFTSQILVLMLGGVIPIAISLFTLAAVGGFAYYYIFGHKQKPPRSTQEIVHVDEKLQPMFQPEKPVTIINLNLISTNLNTGESMVRSLGTLNPHAGETERLLPVLALPRGRKGESKNPEETAPSYAAQDILPQPGPDAASDAASDTASRHGSLSEDYGRFFHEVVKLDPQQNTINLVAPAPQAQQPSECKVNLYMTQGEEKDMPEKRCMEEKEEKKEEEEEEGTFLDWDPRTRVLNIPLLGQLDLEKPTDTQKKTTAESTVDIKLLQRRPVLTSVVVKQSLDEGGEEDIFTKMEKDWGLQIQSNPE